MWPAMKSNVTTSIRPVKPWFLLTPFLFAIGNWTLPWSQKSTVAFFGREATEKGVFGAEGAVLENFSDFLKKLLKKNAIKSDFRKKIGVKIFPKKWVSWNVQKTGKKLKIPPLWGKIFENFGPRGGGFRAPFFGSRGGVSSAFEKTDAGLVHPC